MRVLPVLFSRQIAARIAAYQAFPVLLIFLCVSTGCPLSLLPCGVTLKSIVIRARLVDEVTDVGITRAQLGGLLFTAGAPTSSYRDPLGPHDDVELLLPEADGCFDLTFVDTKLGEVCGIPPFDRTVFDPEFPRPDQIELVIVRDGCEQRFTIDVNEDTVVDLTFPDDVIELVDPILVPECVP